MSFTFDTVEQLSERTIKTLQRYPMASFAAFLVTIVLINLVELHNYPKDSPVVITLTKIAFVSSLGVVLFPALRLLKPHWFMIVLGVGLLGGYYSILPSDIAASESNIFIHHIFLMVAFFIMLLWTPFALLKISNKNIWEWTQNLIVALVASIFFSLILFAGLSLALFAISKLFSVDIAGYRYWQLGIAIFGLYGVNIFLSQVPKYVLLLQTKVYSKAEIIFTKYILTPLALGYFLILYAYSAKVLFTMTWPQGILAWIIVIFSLVAIITYLFWTPLYTKEDQRVKQFTWMAILFQTFMLSAAIGMRIREYGITESRYFVALFGIWLLLISLYFIIRKNANYKWLFLTLSLLLIGSQFGKYSAAEVTKRSQLNRLQTLIEQETPLNETSPIKSRHEISTIIDYLYNYYGIESLNLVLAETIQTYNERNITAAESYFPYFATKELGFTYVDNTRYGYDDEDQEWTFQTYRTTFDIEGYHWLKEFYYYRVNGVIPEQNEKEPFTITMQNMNMFIHEKESATKVDLTALVNRLMNQEKQTLNPIHTMEKSQLEYKYENPKRKVKLLIDNITIAKDHNITNLNCKVLVGEREI